MTGDFFTVPGAMQIDRLELLAGITCPVYVTLGNHERGARALVIRNAMEQYGYTVLQNETACIEHNGHPICIIGIDGRMDSRACMRDMLPDCEAPTTIIVLAHNPAAVHSLPHNSGWLCLSGHTHGGHIVIPWITRRLFRACGQPYMAGRYDVNGNVLYVNSGLGYGYGILPRLGTSPEVAVFTLKCRITNPESPDATETNPMIRRALDG
jgi:predicted MPP superfamily phosphohydrolase